MKRLLQCLTPLLVIIALPAAFAYEEPGFQVVGERDGIQYREYASYLVAETRISRSHSRDKAANMAFRRLFDYISGANTGEQKIAMTTPVQQSTGNGRANSSGTKIDMTTPVQQSDAGEFWTVAFIVPEQYTLQTVPQPADTQVYIREVPAKLVAALRYSGRWTDRNVDRHTAKIQQTLREHGAEATSGAMTAYYNAPFVPPFLRRNEILVEVSALPQTLRTSS